MNYTHQLPLGCRVEALTLGDVLARIPSFEQLYCRWKDHALCSAVEHARVRQISDPDQRNIIKRLHSEFTLRGLRRRVASPCHVEELEALRIMCPNFDGIVDIVQGEIAAAKLAQRAPQIPPLLLLGPPGVGKTHFCQALADTLGAPQHKLCFDTSIATSALGGVDPQWARQNRAYCCRQSVAEGMRIL